MQQFCPSCGMPEHPMEPCSRYAAAGEKRKTLRIPHIADLVIERSGTGICNTGRMLDCSPAGMSFEAQVSFIASTDVLVCFKNSPYSSNPDVHRAKVVWSRELAPDGKTLRHVTGVKYY
jgi:hypothetical protein